MKYIKSICLSVMFSLLFSVITVNNANATEISVKSNNNFEYYVDGNNQIVIKRCKSTEEDINIPDKIDGLTVYKIDEGAFKDCLTVKKVTLPNTINYIGFRAFSNSGITSLVMPDSITTIEPEAFKRCKNLKKIYFSNGLKEIPNCVCSECSALVELYLPTEVTIIGDYAFSECKSLAKVYCPSTVKDKRNDAFSYCNNIKEFNVLGNNIESDIIKETVESMIPYNMLSNVTTSSKSLDEYKEIKETTKTKEITSQDNNGTQQQGSNDESNPSGNENTNILIYVSTIIMSSSAVYIFRNKSKQ